MTMNFQGETALMINRMYALNNWNENNNSKFIYLDNYLSPLFIIFDNTM